MPTRIEPWRYSQDAGFVTDIEATSVGFSRQSDAACTLVSLIVDI